MKKMDIVYEDKELLKSFTNDLKESIERLFKKEALID